MVKRKDYKSLCFNLILGISVLFLVSVFFIGTFSGLVFNQNYYKSLYGKTGTYDRLNESVVEEKTSELYSFFKGKGTLDSGGFTENEISHLQDVKNLIKNIFLVYYISLFLLLLIMIIIYIYFKENFTVFLKKLLFYTGISTIAIVILFFLLSFSGVFEVFHRILFVSNYSFPSTSGLIMLFNEQFFYLFAKRIFLFSMLKGVIAAVFGGFLLYLKK